MFSEILNVIPKLDEKGLRKMQNDLQSRFTKIAKGFGKNLASAITGGGIVALGGALINKLLNPLKETQEVIDKMLKQSDDIATNAAQFGTTAGNLARLRAAGSATGLDEGGLYTLLTKYQTAVAEARQDPKKKTSVRNFVGYKDTAEGFLQYIQGIQKLSPDQQVLAQKEVFGEKQILKMADFLQADFNQLFTQIAGASTAELNKAIVKMAFLNDKADLLTAKRELDDMIGKSRRLSDKNGDPNINMLFQRDANERVNLGRENEKISTYSTLIKVQTTMDNLTATLEKKIFKEMRDWTVIFEGVSKIFALQSKLDNLKATRTPKKEE